MELFGLAAQMAIVVALVPYVRGSGSSLVLDNVPYNQCFHWCLKSCRVASFVRMGSKARVPDDFERKNSNGAFDVLVCGGKLYAYLYRTQSRGWSKTYVHNAVRMVSL